MSRSFIVFVILAGFQLRPSGIHVLPERTFNHLFTLCFRTCFIKGCFIILVPHYIWKQQQRLVCERWSGTWAQRVTYTQFCATVSPSLCSMGPIFVEIFCARMKRFCTHRYNIICTCSCSFVQEYFQQWGLTKSQNVRSVYICVCILVCLMHLFSHKIVFKRIFTILKCLHPCLLFFTIVGALLCFLLCCLVEYHKTFSINVPRHRELLHMQLNAHPHANTWFLSISHNNRGVPLSCYGDEIVLDHSLALKWS